MKTVFGFMGMCAAMLVVFFAFNANVQAATAGAADKGQSMTAPAAAMQTDTRDDLKEHQKWRDGQQQKEQMNQQTLDKQRRDRDRFSGVPPYKERPNRDLRDDDFRPRHRHDYKDASNRVYRDGKIMRVDDIKLH